MIKTLSNIADRMAFALEQVADALVGQETSVNRETERVLQEEWKRGTPRQVRFPRPSYEAIRVTDEFVLVRVPKETKD